jgi:hypothetical protein
LLLPTEVVHLSVKNEFFCENFMSSLKDRLLLNPLKAGTNSDGLEKIKETIYQASEV